ncbi:type III-B CRISPR-associated protein Cas10/Cmr2 [Pantanalinema rosaneae CENA516]|uniref:type III-B CRISPR-associated protein Cas10/Cmr2 n=1 Tax=Pantanalinema rosaneae TaxID=1620701 RepID=UPI003D6E837A
MVNQQDNTLKLTDISIGIAWCLAWGNDRQPQFPLSTLQQMRQALQAGKLDEVPKEVRSLVEQVRQLDQLDFPDQLEALKDKFSELWNQTTEIGLVYGGATKIKGYVFEAAKLPDIRGASALLDRINLIDLPAYFGKAPESETFNDHYQTVQQWLTQHFPGEDDIANLTHALIPELIIYSTGGNILTFCPTAYVDDLANAIEKRYTWETLTANSCAVGDRFRLLELRLGLLKDSIEHTKWLDWYSQNANHDLVKAYFGNPDDQPKLSAKERFKQRKNFNELVTKLAGQFNQRRSGNDLPNRPSRRYPVMFETHPYLRRDSSDRRSAIGQATRLPGEPWFSEPVARKRIAGQRAKREREQRWYEEFRQAQEIEWMPGEFESWVRKFEKFLEKENLTATYNPDNRPLEESHKEARSLREIGDVSTPKGFVAYIYADGNNMGGYIQKQIKTAEEYQRFSEHVTQATEQAVYYALFEHLRPRQIRQLNDPESQDRNDKWIYPFEIITVGGDDVLLVVPADKALQVAKTIGENFEDILLNFDDNYCVQDSSKLHQSCKCHRYRVEPIHPSQCQLSMSTGVLITAEDTPIYYAQRLAEQLLKSAKKYAKQLKQDDHYHYAGGTVDFLVMKSVTMLSSSIETFRTQGLTKSHPGKPTLKLYAAPYTLHDLGGLLNTVQVLKDVDFPRSQLYQLRSLLEQGKHTAMLNYRYFRVRLTRGQQDLRTYFEEAWCKPKDSANTGNLAPWMTVESENAEQSVTYETLWRELVDLYPFVEKAATPKATSSTNQEVEV